MPVFSTQIDLHRVLAALATPLFPGHLQHQLLYKTYFLFSQGTIRPKTQAKLITLSHMENFETMVNSLGAALLQQ